jgi:hypothetical protein
MVPFYLSNTDEWLIAWFLLAKGSSAGAPLQRQYVNMSI